MLVILASLAFLAGRLELSSSYRLKRDNEEELLFRGLAYVSALSQFRSAKSNGGRFPRTLSQLYGDPSIGGSRFIRQLYRDPVTGGDFKAIRAADGAIIGVASASKGIPFRKTGFREDLKAFEKAETYADWEFRVVPLSGARRETSQAQNAAPAGASPTPASTDADSRQ
jgi:hypothetical protein